MTREHQHNAEPNVNAHRIVAGATQDRAGRRWILRGALAFSLVVATSVFVAYHLRWLEQRRSLAAGACDLGPTCRPPGALPLFMAHGYQSIHVHMANARRGPYRLTAAESEMLTRTGELFPEATVNMVAKAP